MLDVFLGNPADPKYRKQSVRARELRSEAEAKVEEATERVHPRTEIFKSSLPYGAGPLTAVLIGLCVAVQVLRVTGFDERVLGELCMTEISTDGGARSGLPEIMQGEFWRLVTPVLVHATDAFWLHLIFNMMALLNLGSMIEDRQGTGRLGWLVVLVAVTSNLFQNWISGPNFYGMSGVVYGLLGYIWVKGRLDPASGFFLHPQIALMMLAWFFLCLVGLVPHVANGAHAAGLVMGAACGFLASFRKA
jgi:GlpG protein